MLKNGGYATPMRQRRQTGGPRPSTRVVDSDEDLPLHATTARVSIRSITRYFRRRKAVLRGLLVLGILFALSFVLHRIFSHPFSVHTLPQSHDEGAVAAYRIPAHTGKKKKKVESQSQSQSQVPLACMPTVTRANGSVEYVSNAVKSWYLVHKRSGKRRIPPLVVYDMNSINSNNNNWASKIGDPSTMENEPWFSIVRLNLTHVNPTRHTLGDNPQRVRWRTKEARDYAGVLRDCARRATNMYSSAASENYVLMVQDDVLFRRDAASSHLWAQRIMNDSQRTRVTYSGKTVHQKVCSASLWENASHNSDGEEEEEMKGSNLVARYWRIDDVENIAAYIERHFDDAPVDWLADRWCRKRRGVVPCKRPNPVRHRGKVSSFAENKRDDLLS